jgi:hypothetical protein
MRIKGVYSGLIFAATGLEYPPSAHSFPLYFQLLVLTPGDSDEEE